MVTEARLHFYLERPWSVLLQQQNPMRPYLINRPLFLLVHSLSTPNTSRQIVALCLLKDIDTWPKANKVEFAFSKSQAPMWLM